MTNEKNSYLTVFESFADPVIMLDRDDHVINYNHAAALLIDAGHIPGGLHYHLAEQAGDATGLGKNTGDSANRGKPLDEVFPLADSGSCRNEVCRRQPGKYMNAFLPRMAMSGPLRSAVQTCLTSAKNSPHRSSSCATLPVLKKIEKHCRKPSANSRRLWPK